MIRILRNNSGMALILTLLVVSFLVAITVELGTSVNWQMQASANQGDIVQLDAMLLSGLQLSRAALLADQQQNDYDTIHDDWGSFEEETLQAFFPHGHMEIHITDLSGLLEINALVLTEEEKKKLDKKQAGGKKKASSKGKGTLKWQDLEKKQRGLWQRFLLSGKYAVEDDQEATNLLDTLSDWLDTDDEERNNGAEQGYYSSLKPGYDAANRPVHSPEELLLVKGWHSALLYGDKEHAAIREYLTATGEEGKININTAPKEILLALHPDMTEELAEILVKYRSDEENKEALKNVNWYGAVSGFAGTGITFDQNLITVSSSFFQIVITVRHADLQRTGRGTLHRLDNREQELLSWKVE